MVPRQSRDRLVGAATGLAASRSSQGRVPQQVAVTDRGFRAELVGLHVRLVP